MKTIIMTIKRRHLRNMELGIKRYELRKTVPRVKDGEKCLVLLCVSGSSGEIAAEFVMDGWRDLTEAAPVELARLAAITAAEAVGYRKKGRGKLYGWSVTRRGKLYGWCVTRFRRYPVAGRPSHINDIGLTRPPQSWQYVRVPYGDLVID